MYELVGTRAQGMGGAFVAVADDATATWWNPAGLATGATISFVFDHGRTIWRRRIRGRRVPPGSEATNGFAFTTPALGFSYYRCESVKCSPFPLTGPDRRSDKRKGRQLSVCARLR